MTRHFETYYIFISIDMATTDYVQSKTSRMKKLKIGDLELLKKVNGANEFGTIGLLEPVVSSKFIDAPEKTTPRMQSL